MIKRSFGAAFVAPSVDLTPWAHPFLTRSHLQRFRDYSERIWNAALGHRRQHPRRLDAAFAINMAQNMYKWAQLASRRGVAATLYLNPQDHTAISRPEWEEFDGEYGNVLDGPGFLASHPGIKLQVPVVESPNEGGDLIEAYARQTPHEEQMKEQFRRFAPLFGEHWSDGTSVASLRQRAPSVVHEPLLKLQGMFPFFRWAEMLSRHEVTYIASTPFPAYVSGKPYCIFSVGGDLQIDAGREGDFGQGMRDAFRGARFILASNPHTLGHCRRLGLTNALYLPYPMDTSRYAPGPGVARAEWTARFGPGPFVLTSSRIDAAVKGHTRRMFDELVGLARARPSVRFLFLGWGVDADAVTSAAREAGLSDQFIVLSPVGKSRLIDYYRSCDIVLDTFVYGYYGATALEAASVGKPVVMKIRKEHYEPLYRGDVAPVAPADTPAEAGQQLARLIDDAGYREQVGRACFEWARRTHGEEHTADLMIALLQFAADRRATPLLGDNPLLDRISADERAYHERCRQDALAS